MNSMQLKDKLKNISKEKNVDFNLYKRLEKYQRKFTYAKEIEYNEIMSCLEKLIEVIN